MVQVNRKMISVKESTMIKMDDLKSELNIGSFDSLLNVLVNDFKEARK